MQPETWGWTAGTSDNPIHRLLVDRLAQRFYIERPVSPTELEIYGLRIPRDCAISVNCIAFCANLV